MRRWYAEMLFTVTSAWGNLDVRLYSLPKGEKSVANDPEKLDPELRRAGKRGE